jgi:hypothetical protein
LTCARAIRIESVRDRRAGCRTFSHFAAPITGGCADSVPRVTARRALDAELPHRGIGMSIVQETCSPKKCVYSSGSRAIGALNRALFWTCGILTFTLFIDDPRPGEDVVLLLLLALTTGCGKGTFAIFMAIILIRVGEPPQYRQQSEADAVVHLTNEDWVKSGQEMLSRYELWACQFRAIETHKWQLMCTTKGYSAIIDPRGVVCDSLPRRQGVLRIPARDSDSRARKMP